MDSNILKQIKINKFILFGCESDETIEIIKLFNNWSYIFINEDREKRNFKVTGWPFMTLVKGNNFFNFQGVCYLTM